MLKISPIGGNSYKWWGYGGDARVWGYGGDGRVFSGGAADECGSD